MNRNQVYQISFQEEQTGKRIAATKRKITWKFGFSSDDAIQAGHTGSACRGEEHEVVLVWSLLSGKYTINSQEIDNNDDAAALYNMFHGTHGVATDKSKLEASLPLRGGVHTVKIVCYSAPPLFPTNGFKQFDLLVDGLSFSDMPHIYKLGLSKTNNATGKPYFLPSTELVRDYSKLQDAEHGLTLSERGTMLGDNFAQAAPDFFQDDTIESSIRTVSLVDDDVAPQVVPPPPPYNKVPNNQSESASASFAPFVGTMAFPALANVPYQAADPSALAIATANYSKQPQPEPYHLYQQPKTSNQLPQDGYGYQQQQQALGPWTAVTQSETQPSYEQTQTCHQQQQQQQQPPQPEYYHEQTPAVPLFMQEDETQQAPPQEPMPLQPQTTLTMEALSSQDLGACDNIIAPHKSSQMANAMQRLVNIDDMFKTFENPQQIKAKKTKAVAANSFCSIPLPPTTPNVTLGSHASLSAMTQLGQAKQAGESTKKDIMRTHNHSYEPAAAAAAQAGMLVPCGVAGGMNQANQIFDPAAYHNHGLQQQQQQPAPMYTAHSA